MTEKKKWHPAHVVAMSLLVDAAKHIYDPIDKFTFIVLARMYAAGVKVPREAIPWLVKEFQNARGKISLEPEDSALVSLAIDQLAQQAIEAKEEDQKFTPPKVCPECNGKLGIVSLPKDSHLAFQFRQLEADKRGDLRCEGECKKFYFFIGGELKPGFNV